MNVTVKAILPVDYDSKKSGRHVSGSEIHYTRPLTEREKQDGGRGTEVVDKVFTRLDTSKIMPEQKYNFVYDMQGGKYPELTEIVKA